MFKLLTIVLFVSPALVLGQQIGTLTPEVHPKLTWQECKKGGQCSTIHGEIVIDADSRWVHDSKGKSCFSGGQWDKTICPDDVTCAKNCALDGVQYEAKYGVSTNGSTLRQNYLTGNTVGSRIYLLANETHYELFQLLGQEFTFDVDVSTLPCGTNGALYLVNMEADGGSAKNPNNKAGARYGTGYCDAQCPKYNHFLNGQLNSKREGACCSEMDIWEANSEAAAFTPHPCTPIASTCTGASCGSTCESEGCDYNSYRLGNHTFYGPGKAVDTNKVFTVVTQFISSDGTQHGDLTEIRRFYVQNGHVIPNSVSTIAGANGANSLTQEYCEHQKKAFNTKDTFTSHGGMKQMGEAIKLGMVMATSLWDDTGVHMLWLDSTFPASSPASEPGVARGPCPITGGIPAEIHPKHRDAYITFSNIKVGPINSTFHA